MVRLLAMNRAFKGVEYLFLALLGAIKPTHLDLFVIFHPLFPIQVQRVFTAESGMLGVKVTQFEVGGTHVGHYAAFHVETSCST